MSNSLQLEKKESPRFQHPFFLLEFGPGGLLAAISPRMKPVNKGVVRPLNYVTTQSEPQLGDSNLILRHDFKEKYPTKKAKWPEAALPHIGDNELLVRRRLLELEYGCWVKSPADVIDWKIGDTGFRFLELFQLGFNDSENGGKWKTISGFSTAFRRGLRKKGERETDLQEWIDRKIEPKHLPDPEIEIWTPEEPFQMRSKLGRRKVQPLLLGETGACALLFPESTAERGKSKDGSCLRFEGIGQGELANFFDAGGPGVECFERTDTHVTFDLVGEPMMFVGPDGLPYKEGRYVCDRVRFPIKDGNIDLSEPVYLATNLKSGRKKPAKDAAKSGKEGDGNVGDPLIAMEDSALKPKDADEPVVNKPAAGEEGSVEQGGEKSSSEAEASEDLAGQSTGEALPEESNPAENPPAVASVSASEPAEDAQPSTSS